MAKIICMPTIIRVISCSSNICPIPSKAPGCGLRKTTPPRLKWQPASKLVGIHSHKMGKMNKK